MNICTKRIDSIKRMLELEKDFINVIKVFTYKNPDLTTSEIASVMLEMLTEWNNGDL